LASKGALQGCPAGFPPGGLSLCPLGGNPFTKD
jgi:hypothetical protein